MFYLPEATTKETLNEITEINIYNGGIVKFRGGNFKKEVINWNYDGTSSILKARKLIIIDINKSLGNGHNSELITSILRMRKDSTIPYKTIVGGGIRTTVDAYAMINRGADAIILSSLFLDPITRNKARSIFSTHRDKCILSLDVYPKDGKFMIKYKGWSSFFKSVAQKCTDVESFYKKVLNTYCYSNPAAIMVTNIAKTGSYRGAFGPKKFWKKTDKVIYRGGVRGFENEKDRKHIFNNGYSGIVCGTYELLKTCCTN